MKYNFVYSNFFYIGILLFSLVGIAMADWLYKLAFFVDPKSSGLAIGLTAVLLLCFDVLGIALGIFSTNQNYVSGLFVITPNLPLEEFLFLFLLGYVTLLTYRLCLKYLYQKPKTVSTKNNKLGQEK